MSGRCLCQCTAYPSLRGVERTNMSSGFTRAYAIRSPRANRNHFLLFRLDVHGLCQTQLSLFTDHTSFRALLHACQCPTHHRPRSTYKKFPWSLCITTSIPVVIADSNCSFRLTSCNIEREFLPLHVNAIRGLH